MTLYGREELCIEALEQWRWPQGFVYPSRGHAGAPLRLRTRALWQCRPCQHQASVTAGTIFAATKLPLTTWFLAMLLLTQQKNGISALALKRHLGVSYLNAWRIKHKPLRVMKERDDQTPLGGVIEVDDAYWGGERHGAKPGRGSPNKVPFIAALSCTAAGHPIGLRLGKVAGFRKREVERFAKRRLRASARRHRWQLSPHGLARVPLAQHGHQPCEEQPGWFLSSGERQASAALPDGVLLSLQSPLWSGRHATAPGMGCHAYTAHATPPPENG